MDDPRINLYCNLANNSFFLGFVFLLRSPQNCAVDDVLEHAIASYPERLRGVNLATFALWKPAIPIPTLRGDDPPGYLRYITDGTVSLPLGTRLSDFFQIETLLDPHGTSMSLSDSTQPAKKNTGIPLKMVRFAFIHKH